MRAFMTSSSVTVIGESSREIRTFTLTAYKLKYLLYFGTRIYYLKLFFAQGYTTEKSENGFKIKISVSKNLHFRDNCYRIRNR